MGRIPTIDWKRVDPFLIHAAILSRRKRGPALKKIAEHEGIALDTLYDRLERLGATFIEARMGSRVASRWLRQMKNLIRIASTNMQLQAMAEDRYYELLVEIRQHDQQEYTLERAARLLHCRRTTLLFWTDILQALKRNERGRFTGKELRRFWQEDRYLLVAARAIQKEERLRNAGLR